LELLTKSSQMINHQWCFLLCRPLCRKKNWQVLKLLNSTSLVMFKFNFQQDESAIFFVCLKHCMKLNTFLVKICYAFEIISFVIKNFIFVSSHMSIEDYFFALWLKFNFQQDESAIYGCGWKSASNLCIMVNYMCSNSLEGSNTLCYLPPINQGIFANLSRHKGGGCVTQEDD
jgi:hypothetical protein